MTEDKRTRPTFAGAVAALWLEYVHNLMLIAVTCDAEGHPPLPPEQFTALCDRVERLLIHLENTSMPIPGMTIEDVIEMGREIAQEQEGDNGELERRAEDYQDGKVRAEEKVEERRREGEAGQASGREGDPEEDPRYNPPPEPPKPDTKPVRDPEATKLGQGYCANCGHHGASNAHRDACMKGEPRTTAPEKRLCKNCGHHVRSNAHRAQCLSRVQRPPVSDPPQEKRQGGAVKCDRCDGQMILEGDGDMACLQCGYRIVAPQFGAGAARATA